MLLAHATILILRWLENTDNGLLAPQHNWNAYHNVENSHEDVAPVSYHEKEFK